MKKLVFSGFGGQGVLTAGQIVAQIAMHQGKQVTWMPSYGPEMRGGTANCAVIIADTPIGSPMVQTDIDILLAFNPPSVDKFLPHVKSGGTVLVNSSIVKDKVGRDDVTVVEVDATNIAVQVGSLKVQNMAMLGGLMRATGLFGLDEVRVALDEAFGKKYPQLIAVNLEAVGKE